MENVSRKCNINLPISRERKQGLVYEHISGLGRRHTVLMETHALSVWGLPLRTLVSREVGGGNWSTEGILFEPDNYLLHLIPEAITHFCNPLPNAIEKVVFWRRRLKGLRCSLHLELTDHSCTAVSCIAAQPSTSPRTPICFFFFF